METRQLTIFADYFQFVVMDETSTDAFATIWTEQALQRMLAVGDRSLCLGTLRNVDVTVEIRLLPSKPDVDFTSCDHAASASLDVPSGVLAIIGCTGYLPDAARIVVAPGTYEALYLLSGVDSIQTVSGLRALPAAARS